MKLMKLVTLYLSFGKDAKFLKKYTFTLTFREINIEFVINKPIIYNLANSFFILF